MKIIASILLAVAVSGTASAQVDSSVQCTSTLNLIAKSMQAKIKNPDVRVVTKNGLFYLEGSVDSLKDSQAAEAACTSFFPEEYREVRTTPGNSKSTCITAIRIRAMDPETQRQKALQWQNEHAAPYNSGPMPYGKVHGLPIIMSGQLED